jgi:ribonuclease P protein component
VLPAAARLRRREDFSLVVRLGRRAGRQNLVVHYLPDPSAAPPSPALAGFIVGRSVGNSVVRHRVTRRLRHLVRDRLPLLPPGSKLVVRALPPAAAADSGALGRDLDGAFGRLGLAAASTAAEAVR